MYTTNNDVNAKQNFNTQSLMVIGYFKKLIILHIFVTRKYDRGKCYAPIALGMVVCVMEKK